jgi:signal transduction histidine kinase
MAALIAGDLVLLASGVWPPAVFAACLLWGVHWAVVQGPMLGVVVGLAPPHLKGTAFGIFYSVMALTAVVANTVYGSIWHAHGAGAAFALSAAVISAALALALPRLLPRGRLGSAAAAAKAPPQRSGEEGGGGGAALAPAAA